MKAHETVVSAGFWIPALMAAAFLQAAAADTDETRLRGAISRALAFLAKGGERWMEEKNCNSCHHLPELLWSHREARRRGFAIDPAKFQEWQSWAEERAAEKKPGVEEAALMILALPHEPAPALREIIAQAQLADGSWKPAGQFATMQRRETPEAQESSTRLALLALGTREAASPTSAAAVLTRAAPFLERAAAPRSVETLVLRGLDALRRDAREEARAARDDLLRRQHADGGWAWMIAEPVSDPLATGEVLHLLGQFPDRAAAGAIARAQQWLLSSQREDGSWTTDITRVSRIDRSGTAKAKSLREATEIYHYWGTAWATIGLLHGVRVVE